MKKKIHIGIAKYRSRPRGWPKKIFSRIFEGQDCTDAIFSYKNWLCVRDGCMWVGCTAKIRWVCFTLPLYFISIYVKVIL